ncbi:hypothetical protein BDB00DRAFT_816472 [Zychaea mexicana]|uniref:uncharacterized protein n=1 Tax=Zychaea mexicana TaxID=64656 RepID=UPI0022FE9497|nr:uncharacterized protein BDB00DRAFT_816472 [Zychaea mexicana]KAI9494966.1 hypothetical protein BDB00DRAFT_816472 [Zychaea mexicana]
MTLAAATEKYVRHKSPPQVKCEDLTAREFAQLTGIKIVDATCTSPPLEYSNETTTLSNDSCTTTATTAQPRIWDSDFWQQQGGQRRQQQQQQQPEHCHHHHHHHHEPPNPRVIMKGRFKIMMGEDDEDRDSNNTTASVPITNCARQVVEWKRKRSA